MNESSDALRAAHRLAYGLGLGLCLGTSGLITLLLRTGVLPPGTEAPVGTYLQLGYLFTGIVFLSATWVWWRRAQSLRGLKDLPEAQRPARIFHECLLYAAVFEASCLCGLIYWLLVGAQASRHAWGFILMTPLLFLTLVPSYRRWEQALVD